VKKQNAILLILLVIGLYSFIIPKKLKGSVKAEPLDPGEFLPDDYNVPNYQD
jgi:hypothetical protein